MKRGEAEVGGAGAPPRSGLVQRNVGPNKRLNLLSGQVDQIPVDIKLCSYQSEA
jgi:hypothetical protein